MFVRKRPLFDKEAKGKAFDVVSTVSNEGGKGGRVVMHEPRKKVDLEKVIENSIFDFDRVFNEESANGDVYSASVTPLLEKMERQPETTATVFAYGQTGSGKTYTISSFYVQAAEDVLAIAERRGLAVSVRFFEIYGGKCFDLLSGRKQVQPLEDEKGKVNLHGLTNYSATHMMDIVDKVESGLSCRSTGSTSANEMSSRSHSLLELVIHRPGDVEDAQGKLALVDLAGSERGADRGADNRRMRQEGAEINKSLLSLKECIRALYTNGGGDHVPFRGSRLTHILRDAFIGRNSHTVLLAHISPASTTAEHSLNTLRYAHRIKESPSAAELNNNAAPRHSQQKEKDREKDKDKDKPAQLRKPFQPALAEKEPAPPPPGIEEEAVPSNSNADSNNGTGNGNDNDNASSNNRGRQRAQWRLPNRGEGIKESKAREQAQELKRHKRSGAAGVAKQGQEDPAPLKEQGQEEEEEEDGQLPPTPVRALQDQPATNAVVSRRGHERKKDGNSKQSRVEEGEGAADRDGPKERVRARERQPAGRGKRPPHAWNANERGGGAGESREAKEKEEPLARAARVKEEVSQAIAAQERVDGGGSQGGRKGEWLQTKELAAIDKHSAVKASRVEAENELMDLHASALSQLARYHDEEAAALEKAAEEKREGDADTQPYVACLERCLRDRAEVDAQLRAKLDSLKHHLEAESHAERTMEDCFFSRPL